MKILLTQAKTEPLAIESVQAMCGREQELIQLLLPFTFAIERNKYNNWYIIHIDKPDLPKATVEMNDRVFAQINELRNWLRKYLGYDRKCNRCNHEVIDITVWSCPECGCVEWRCELP